MSFLRTEPQISCSSHSSHDYWFLWQQCQWQCQMGGSLFSNAATSIFCCFWCVTHNGDPLVKEVVCMWAVLYFGLAKCKCLKNCMLGLIHQDPYDPRYMVASSILSYRVKTDNGHGLIAHSSQVPPYLTQLLIWKLGIMIVPSSINLKLLSNLLKQQPTERPWFLCIFTTMVPWHMLLSYIGLPTSTSQAAIQCMHAFPFSKQYCICKIFLLWHPSLLRCYCKPAPYCTFTIMVYLEHLTLIHTSQAFISPDFRFQLQT